MCRNEHTSNDQSMSVLGKRIGIIGFGNQGRAQALNLRDAGLDVLIGARKGGKSETTAREERFVVETPTSLGDSCDLIAVLTPEETHGTLLASLADAKRAKIVVFAHGYSLRYLDLPIPEDWDVLLVAPSGPGTALRRNNRAGRIPALIAVHEDRSGSAWERVRSYAYHSGCSKSALIETTVAAEAEIDLFGEQAVLCGGVAALVTAAWETLVDAGYDPVIAYLECVHQVGLTSEMITQHGVAGMRERISKTALFGDLTRGQRLIGPKVRAKMAEILDEIRSGRFANEMSEEVASGYPRIQDGLEKSRHHHLEQAGRTIRNLASGEALDSEDSHSIETE